MIIASRDLKLRRDGRVIIVSVHVRQPTNVNGSWTCRYEIDWPDGKRTMEAGGFDAMQALIHALGMIGAEIYTSDYHKSGQLYFDKPGRGYGFPVASNLRDLLIGDDATYF